MNKNIICGTVLIMLGILKLPATIMSAICQLIEYWFTVAVSKLVRWSEDETIIEVFNYTNNENAEAYKDISEVFEELNIE